MIKYRNLRTLLFGAGLFFQLCFSLQLQAQEQLGLRDKAEKLFDELQYAKASELYLKLTDTPKPRCKDMERLAECYKKMNRYEDAEIWYSRVVENPKSTDQDLFDYGEILKANAGYSDAREVFLDYIKKTGDSKRALLNIAGCDSAEVWMGTPTGHVLRNEDAINSELSEFSVFPFGDRTMCFIGEPPLAEEKDKYGWTGSPYLRIYVAAVGTNNRLESRSISKSTYNDVSYHVGPISSNASGSMYFITRTYPGEQGGLIRVNGNMYRTQHMELYVQVKKYGKWLTPVAFPFNNVQKYSLGHAILSKDEKVLYFVSDMPGGQGGTDIWYSELRPNGTWGKCRNAGSVINTPGDEMFPTVGPDGTLYFSSNGFPGMGGLDIYSSKGNRESWSTPVNMRYPVNSPNDDFSYLLNDDQKSGYLSSNRANGKGGDDIYSFDLRTISNLLTVEGFVYDKKTRNKLPGADLVLYDTDNNILAKQKSNPDGSFRFKLRSRDLSRLQGSKDSYYPDTVAFGRNDLSSDKLRKVALYLDPLFEKGKTFRLENIHYDFDKDNIRKDAATILNGLVRIMHENPTLEIELGSHTDSRGNDSYNLDLSQRRAQSVVDYLVSRGISRNRMVAKGYGETRLLYVGKDGKDISEIQHQQNRRTEFTILSY